LKPRIVPPNQDKALVLSSHDITLPHLGPMYFMMSPTEDRGAMLYYIKKKDLISFDGSDGWRRGIPLDYYCRFKVRLNILEEGFGVELDTKIQSSIPKFKRWLIDQDNHLGELLTSRRTVRL